MGLLCAARLLIALVPFGWWRATLGRVQGPAQAAPSPVNIRRSARLAAHVERAASRLPFATKCLPRAMALAWLLRGRGLAYVCKLAVRPAAGRGSTDDLHAWIECGETIVLGELAGPWIVLLALAG